MWKRERNTCINGADAPVKVAWNLLGSVFPSTIMSVAIEKHLRIQTLAFSRAFVFMLAVVLRNTLNTMEDYFAVSCSLYYFAAIWCLQKAKDFNVMDREKTSTEWFAWFDVFYQTWDWCCKYVKILNTQFILWKHKCNCVLFVCSSDCCLSLVLSYLLSNVSKNWLSQHLIQTS